MSSPATIRTYAPEDLDACRRLWRELTEHHRELYADPAIGGADPGRGFDVYLTDARPVHLWVAEADGLVGGLAGLLLENDKAELEPVVVTASWRGRGVGRLLAETVVEAARELGVRQVRVRPVGRNAEAIRFFHALGFDVLGRVDLRLDLHSRSRDAGEQIAGRTFVV